MALVIRGLFICEFAYSLLCAKLLQENAARKMLVKLTPGRVNLIIGICFQGVLLPLLLVCLITLRADVFSRNFFHPKKEQIKYSQTWTNDHLRLATAWLQRPLFWGPIFDVNSTKVPLNNDHLSTTAIIFGSQRWSFYTGLTVFFIPNKFWTALNEYFYRKALRMGHHLHEQYFLRHKFFEGGPKICYLLIAI